MGKQIVKRDGKEKEEVAIVAWTNENRARVASAPPSATTPPRSRIPVTSTSSPRGVLWAAGKLEEPGYLGTAYTGENTGHLRTRQTHSPARSEGGGSGPGSEGRHPRRRHREQRGDRQEQPRLARHRRKQGHPLVRRESLAAAVAPARIRKPQTLTEAKIAWESGNNAYKTRLEASTDGKAWTVLADLTRRPENRRHPDDLLGQGREVSQDHLHRHEPWRLVQHPRDRPRRPHRHETPSEARRQTTGRRRRRRQEGERSPREGREHRAEDREALPAGGSRGSQGREGSRGIRRHPFSNWQAANYPVYVAAAPNGDLYVSSDGNGSLGREPGRGRVLRLRDKDGDGRADEVKEFVKNIDSPRGLIWDHDRLYLLHPPHISVFFDRDGDGISEESKKLIDGIAFDFFGTSRRPQPTASSSASMAGSTSRAVTSGS